MATDIASLIDVVRGHLNEREEDLVNGYWTDDDLAAHFDAAVRDLWRAINDNFQHYFVTIDETNVSMPSGASALTGVPTDVSIVRGLECRDLTSRPGVVFEHKDFMHADFQRARALGTQDPSYGSKIYYCLMGAGAPIAAPTIRVAPAINATLPLRLVYVPTIPRITPDSANPVPGESDQALIAYCVAHAMAKSTEGNEPDAGWMTIYANEKKNILTALTPRQTDDEDIAEAIFEDLWQ